MLANNSLLAGVNVAQGQVAEKKEQRYGERCNKQGGVNQ